jgi:hypothetical protein
MRDEAVNGLRALDIDKSAEDVKTMTAIIKTQYNLENMLFNLPDVIKKYKEDQERKEAHRKRMTGNAETGFIGRDMASETVDIKEGRKAQ